jgi:hydroxymethylbilane synthase
MLRIGTRRSRLAMVQSEHVQTLLTRQGVDAEIVPMTTTGDEGAPAASSAQG